MEINKLSQTPNVERYEMNSQKASNEEKAPVGNAPQDKVEISKEALQAAEAQKEQTTKKSDPNGILKLSAEERAELVSKLKDEMAQNQAKFFEYVKTTLVGQGKALADGDEIWRFLAKGDYEVDPQTKAEAQEAISEDGFYGVKQVSSRLFDFALALSGGDPKKMKLMEEAFETGFKEATKSWGKDLPDISNQTYNAVKEKFAAFYKEQESAINNE